MSKALETYHKNHRMQALIVICFFCYAGPLAIALERLLAGGARAKGLPAFENIMSFPYAWWIFPAWAARMSLSLHQSDRLIPAMAAGAVDGPWEVGDLVGDC